MIWKPTAPADHQEVSALQETLQVPSLIAQLLAQRKITTYANAKAFFRPQWEALYDPFLMKDMDLAVARIESAITSKEKIMIYGDYDVDGTTAVALVYSYLNTLAEVVCYIPDRYSEGYGISKKGINTAQAEGISLIISLDCGIKAIDQVAYANSLGIDFIICDHHQPGNQLPSAVAILDPKQAHCAYPFDGLCGCGIGFKLVQALMQPQGATQEQLMPYLDLVATAIAADIVPLIDENRILTYFGLQQLHQAPRPGIAYFFKELKNKATVSDLVFKLAPRINAAGRMEHAIKAVDLLTATTSEEVKPLARTIEFNNSERRSKEEKITQEALAQASQSQEAYTTVVFDAHWHKGVIGIVASRLIEQYYRPTVVLTQSGDHWAGSVRSVRGFDVYCALEACQDTLLQFGGHKYAAGLTLETHQLEAFKNRFEAVVQAQIKPDQRAPQLIYDLEVVLDQISPKVCRIMAQMAPFGPQNMRPVLVTHQCKDTGGSRAVGQDQAHLRLELTDPSGATFTGIGFNQASHLLAIKSQNPFSICYTVEENHFNNQVSLQLKIKDLRFD